MCPQRKVPNLETLQKVPVKALSKVPISLLVPTQISLQQVWTGSALLLSLLLWLLFETSCQATMSWKGAWGHKAMPDFKGYRPVSLKKWERGMVLGHPLQLCLILQKSTQVNSTSLPFLFIPFADYGEKSILVSQQIRKAISRNQTLLHIRISWELLKFWYQGCSPY